MPDQRKQRTRGHVIADLSENFVTGQILRCGYTVERIRADYGIDLLMHTYDEDGYVENGQVNFQLKATDSPSWIEDAQQLSVRVSRKDLDHWLIEPYPVILVVYLPKSEEAFWRHIQASDLMEEHQRHQTKITIHIPKTQRLDHEAIQLWRRLKAKINTEFFQILQHTQGPQFPRRPR